ncbi:hypothetical protein E4U58_000943 [Claviceps cyperi]|nr:hypothetical protein E4U58_000943 [Claviceps cyperi]
MAAPRLQANIAPFSTSVRDGIRDCHGVHGSTNADDDSHGQGQDPIFAPHVASSPGGSKLAVGRTLSGMRSNTTGGSGGNGLEREREGVERCEDWT